MPKARQAVRGLVALLLGVVAVLGPVVGSALAQGEPLAVVDTREGEALYVANCASCHQLDGSGIAGAFPPLAGHVPRLLAAPQGRDYLAAVVLNGLTGVVTVAGSSYDGVMPARPDIGDPQLASILNYVASAWGNSGRLPPEFVAYDADEIALRRFAALDSGSLLRWRAELLD